jgi:hypothetical protein
MTSITSAMQAQAVKINSGAINCRSVTLNSDVALGCKRSI